MLIRPIALILSIIALACAGPAKEQEPPPMEPEKPLDVQPPALLERSPVEVEVNADVELWARGHRHAFAQSAARGARSDLGTWVASHDGAAWSSTLLDDVCPRVVRRFF